MTFRLLERLLYMNMKKRSSEDYSDEALLQAYFRDGDLAAFERLYGRYKQKIYNLFLRRTGDRNTAEEYTQEVFFRLIRSGRRFTNRATFGAYLFTIALHLLQDRERTRKRLQAIREKLIWFMEEQHRQESIQGRLEQEEMHLFLKNMLHELPISQFKIVELVKFQGLSHREAAKIMGISEKAARQTLYRALQTLRKKAHQLKGFQNDL